MQGLYARIIQRNLKMIKAILFDMDGVLIDSHDAWLERFNSALNHFGFKEVSVEEFDKYIWAINFAETVEKYFPGVGIDKIRDYYFETFDKFIGKVKKIKNVDKTLEYVRGNDLKTAVVSNTQSNIVKRILDKIKIIKYFDLIVGGERVKQGKPDPEIIFIACDELRLEPKDVVLIGDTVYDKQAAKAAGCGFIGYKLEKGITDLIKIKELV